MAATCMAVCKGSRKKIRGIFISSCHLPAAVECDIVILSEPGPNPTGPSWAVLQTQLIPARGRKPVLFGALHHGLGHNLSPRGDGNKSSAYFPISSEGHNLSPRGDGNARNSPLIISASATQLIPARGRKLLLNATNASVSRHNLSPRGDGWAIVDIGLYYAATTKI